MVYTYVYVCGCPSVDLSGLHYCTTQSCCSLGLFFSVDFSHPNFHLFYLKMSQLRSGVWPTSRAIHASLGRQRLQRLCMYSLAAVWLPGEAAATTERSAARPLQNTIGELLHNTSSSTFMANTETKFAPFESSEKSSVAQSMKALVDSHQYGVLLLAFMTVTSNEAGIEKIKASLGQAQIAYFLGVLVDHLKRLLMKRADFKGSAPNNVDMRMVSEKSKQYILAIRTIYSRLIFGVSRNSENHIYDKSKRSIPFDTSRYVMGVADYENMIRHEYHNNKHDLVMKWFSRFEKQYGNNMLTAEMWKIRLELALGGAALTQWKVKELDLYKPKNVSEYKLKLFKSWKEVYAEFLALGCSRDVNIDEVVLMGMAKDNQESNLIEFIEGVWGIKREGSPGTLVSPSNIHYPTINTLKTIVAVFSYNRKFFTAMDYVNRFQEAYGLFDLGNKLAMSFWNSVFWWGDQCTRFDDKRVLKLFMKDIDQGHVESLEKAQQNADFDLEKYMVYLDELKNKRASTMNDLWEIFLNSNQFYLPQIYRNRARMLQESLDEDRMYDFLVELGKKYQMNWVSSTSFNARFAPSYSKNIRILYSTILKKLVDQKGFSGFIGQCQPLINEWSLDGNMALETQQWLHQRIFAYREKLEEMREQKMVEQRTDGDETLLDLF